MKQEPVKILFKFYSNIFQQDMVEVLWAIEVDKEKGLYLLNNFPYYAPLIASEDIVYAEFNKEEDMLTYVETKDYSGNSVVQVVVLDNKANTSDLRLQFDTLGCHSEEVQDNYFAMEILYEKDYRPIKEKLDKIEKDGIIGYGEPCLSEKHNNDLK